ncbi:hypothetical protein CUJ83_03310 [Methanocella sp. CWC-04]|uniref:J domain-containing protein n=1 Tax=Methanooceanicella nereidis TaxID=2052831 RepID=A0AAP2RBI9_9EURY|nr:hypothetical protein [Methanocella sp. CWC-04]
MDKNYYEILGLDASASIDDIKKAYRILAKKYHPDVNKDPRSGEIFKSVSEAYEILSDETTRAEYDSLRSPRPNYHYSGGEKFRYREEERATDSEHGYDNFTYEKYEKEEPVEEEYSEQEAYDEPEEQAEYREPVYERTEYRQAAYADEDVREKYGEPAEPVSEKPEDAFYEAEENAKKRSVKIYILSLIVPGLYQIYSGERKFGSLLLIVYFIFWVLAFLQNLGIGLLAMIIWAYSVYDAYATLNRPIDAGVNS